MKYFSFLFLFSFMLHPIFAQMAVVDVVGNSLNSASLKMQAIERQTSIATKVVLSAMSGDITGSLEALTHQNEILKNSQELKNTLGDVIKASRIYEEWKNRIYVSKTMFEQTQESLDELLDNEKLSEETISDFNYSLSKIRNLTDASNDMFLAATDTKDEIDRITRLEKLQESDANLEEVIKELQELESKINALKKGFALRYEVVSMNLPPYIKKVEGSTILAQASLDKKQRKKYFSSIGQTIDTAIQQSPYKQFFLLISEYLNLVFITVIASVAVYVQRAKGWANIYGLIKSVFELLVFFTLLKLVIASII
ncbi:hypothetical protein [Chondrinema litorale]|uniref:hypothetical protein n=1 Tax=Chondrinema litorale TaxID=2994555 RepID=UPI0025432C55|nr:hypothetical protein [Chondrinema litorale]UZR98996.1 hypothetical protein OQ292_33910 [Chondrinema litorale]